MITCQTDGPERLLFTDNSYIYAHEIHGTQSQGLKKYKL